MRITRLLLWAAAASPWFLATVPLVSAAAPTLTVTSSVVSSGSVPLGAQRVEFLRMSFTASCDEDITVHEISLRHQGLGDPQDIDGLSAWVSSRRVSRSVSPEDRDGRVTLRPRGLIVPKCATVSVAIRGDLSPDAAAGGEHRFVLEESGGIATSPVATVRISATPGGRQTVAPQTPQAVEVQMLGVTQTVSYGAGRTVARLRVRSTGTRDQRILGITLTNDGSASNTDLQNLVLVSAKREVMTDRLASLNGSVATFTFTTPLILTPREERIITLRADVRASRRRTIDFEVEEPSDVIAEVCTGARSCNQAH